MRVMTALLETEETDVPQLRVSSSIVNIRFSSPRNQDWGNLDLFITQAQAHALLALLQEKLGERP